MNEQAQFTFDCCLSCTACMSVCPVMAATPDYKGPKLVGVAHERMRFSQEDIEDSLELCTNCKNCDRTCPSDVKVSTLNMLARAEYFKKHPHTRMDDILAHHESIAKKVRNLPLGQHWANLGLRLGNRLHAFKRLGIAKERHLPRYAVKTFYERFKKLPPLKDSSRKIVFYPGCTGNENEPHIGLCYAELLRENGVEVIIDEEFVCCGSPMLQGGYLDDVRKHADRNAARLIHWKEQNIPVVCACPSCSLMLKSEYAEIFPEEKFRAAGDNVYDAAEYLALLTEEGAAQIKSDKAGTGLYHAPCHLKSQGIGLPAVKLLRSAGFSVIIADVPCCGMAGTFGYRRDKYAVSMAIGAPLFQIIKDCGADYFVSDCSSCRKQMFDGTGVVAQSPFELLGNT